MHTNKLLDLLKTFDNQDWREASIYVKHTLGKSSREMLLFDYIKRYKRNLDSPKLDMRVARNVVAPGVESKSFFNILYRLAAHVEEHLMIKELRAPGNYVERKSLLTRVYKMRGLNDQLVSEIKSLKKEIGRKESVDIWQNAHLMRIYYEYYISDAKDESLAKENLFDDLIGSFEDFTCQLTLLCLTEKTNIQNFLGESSSVRMPFFLQNPKGIRKTEATELLHYIYDAVKNRDELHYQKLKDLFMRQKDILSSDLYFFILIQLFNQVAYLTRKGLLQYGRDMLDYYELGLQSGVLLKNKKLSEKRFFNIIDLACKMGEWDWIRKFRNKWSPGVETKHHNEVNVLADAYEFFTRKKYKEALDIINKVKTYKNVSLALRSKWLGLCCLYEMYEDDEITYQHIGSFKSYLSRHRKQISSTTLKGTENFIKVVELMIRHERKEKIMDFIDSCELLNFRSWIEGKMDEKHGSNRHRALF